MMFHTKTPQLLKLRVLPGRIEFDAPKISHFKDWIPKINTILIEKNKDFTELPF